MKLVQALELGFVGLTASSAVRALEKAAVADADAKKFEPLRPPFDDAARIARETAKTHRETALLNGLMAAGMLGLVVWSWKDPYRSFGR